MYEAIRRHLCGGDGERLRRLALLSLRITDGLARLRLASGDVPRLPARVFGLTFPNPVGLAAGFDRHGDWLGCVCTSGFGFVEIGTINGATSVPTDPAVNRTALNLECYRKRCPRHDHDAAPLIGVSVGSTRPVMDEQWASDCLAAMGAVCGYADYLVLNLKLLGDPKRGAGTDPSVLRSLLRKVRSGCESLPCRVPVIIKVAFDEDRDQRHASAAIILAEEAGYDGVLTAFENWSSPDRVAERLARLKRELPSLAIIAVGGVASAETVRDYLSAGASLVQLYTALLRQGPGVARRIVTRLREYTSSVSQ